MRAVWKFPALALAVLGVVGVPRPARAQNATTHSSDYFNFIELNIYGGYSDYKKISSGLGTKIDGSVVLGGRVTENFWNYVAIEESVGVYSWNKEKFLSQQPGYFVIPFQLHIVQPQVNLVLHFTPRDHKFRPFVTAGAGWANYVLGKTAKTMFGALPLSAGASNYGSDVRFQFNYGGGIKYQMTPHFGIRIDVRGYAGPQPQYNFSSQPSTTALFIPGKILNGIEATGGFTVYLGHRGEKPAPAAPAPTPAPTPAPRTLGSINPGSISASTTSVCPGDAVQLSSNASDPEGHRLNYQWSVNGNNQGGDSSQYTFTPSSAGDYRVGLHIADATDASRTADASPVSIHTGVYNRPTASAATANPSELERGQTSMLHVTGSGSECSGTLRYRWAATEGAITGSGENVEYNSSSVAFNEGDRSRPQSKQVTATATVTDSRGGSATASANLTVNLPAQSRHYGDILFPKNSARVNNCGKRVLIEQLYPLLTANPNYDVVLVGHIDSSEAPSGRSRRGRNLDRDRVMQTAGVLSGGSGTCSALDRSRIKGSWVGATQETESVPTSCAVSTAAPKERKGAAIEDTNEAKNRRVEIWLVPKGMQLPAAARDAKELPETDLQRIGCPK